MKRKNGRATTTAELRMSSPSDTESPSGNANLEIQARHRMMRHHTAHEMMRTMALRPMLEVRQGGVDLPCLDMKLEELPSTSSLKAGMSMVGGCGGRWGSNGCARQLLGGDPDGQRTRMCMVVFLL